MTIQIEEIRAAALVNETYSGDLGGLLKDFYLTTGNPDNVTYLLEPEWLRLMGYDDALLPDQWQDYIANFGFTGILALALQAEADAGNLFPQYNPAITFAILAEDGSFLLTEDDFHILKQ